MKIFSAAPGPSSVDANKAWGCLLINLLALPGLGSLVGGRKAGWGQMVLSIGGVLVAAVSLMQILMQYWNMAGGEEKPIGFDRFLVGLGIFLAGWLWSGWTSYQIFRAVRSGPPPIPGPVS